MSTDRSVAVGSVIVTSLIIASCSDIPSAPIDAPGLRSAEIEEMPVGITPIDIEAPRPPDPVERPVEIVQLLIPSVLPSCEDESQVGISPFPENAEYVIVDIDVEQIVEVDLIDRIHLLGGQSEFISHFIREEQSLTLGILIAHRLCADGNHDEGHK